MSVAISQAIHRLDTIRPRRAQRRATRDMKRAYRQLPVWQKHQHFHIICAWHPLEGRWKFAELKGLAFGISVAVLHFNRVPAQIIAIARTWLGIPAINFFDDVRLHAVESCASLMWDTFNWLINKIGWLFDTERFCNGYSRSILGFD